jgi:hypothetical protein
MYILINPIHVPVIIESQFFWYLYDYSSHAFNFYVQWRFCSCDVCVCMYMYVLKANFTQERFIWTGRDYKNNKCYKIILKNTQ